MKLDNNQKIRFSEQDKAKKQSNFKNSIKAGAISGVVQCAAIPVSLGVGEIMGNISKKMSNEQIDVLNKTADLILEKTGLSQKGVKIIDNILVLKSKIPGKIREIIDPSYAAAKGKNAFFTPANNAIIINRQKLPTTIFHEMGHAFNYNCSAFWKTMQKMRTPAMIIATTLALFGAFTNKAEAKDGQELNKGQKAKNFVRKNSGILAFAAMLPIIAEEVMASVRGCSWAKANLSKDLFNKVLKTNVLGAVSYVASAAGIGLAAYLATKIKDKAVEKNKMKTQESQENIKPDITNKLKEAV